MLSEIERVYVVLRRGVSGIITRADLRKPPVRLLIFGLVSLLDMHLSYWTGELFPKDSWREQITKARQTKLVSYWLRENYGMRRFLRSIAFNCATSAIFSSETSRLG
jgi:hypothetical protein